MKHITDTLVEHSGFQRVDRVDIHGPSGTTTLIPNQMNDQLAGWRWFASEEYDQKIEIVGNPEGDEKDYSIMELFAKSEGAELILVVAWQNSDRVSLVSTTLPHTVFWQGSNKISKLEIQRSDETVAQ